MGKIDKVADAIKGGAIRKKSNGKYYYSVPTDTRRNGEMLVTQKQISEACKKHGIEITGFNGFTFIIKK